MRSTKSLESLIQDILKSRAQSRIYLYLLRKNGAKTQDIIKGTRLHPSTVRESLVKMIDNKLIFRKKQKNDNIGKNPYSYFPLAPIKLLKRYTAELEMRLNHLATLSMNKNDEKSTNVVQIHIIDREGNP